MAIAPGPTEITYDGQTDRGQHREINEDSILFERLLVGSGKASREWLLMAVADGVGGHQRGEWASKKALSVLTAELPRLLKRAEPLVALREAVEKTNARTFSEATRAHLDGSATTLVVTLIDDSDRLWLANVGDSRAYVTQGGKIRRATTDHSWVEEQVQAGRMTSEEARSSDQKNIITRSVGFSDSVDVDVDGPHQLRAGDRVILCSDGLSDQVTDDEIEAEAQSGSPRVAAANLITLANNRGGPDNISVVICAVEGTTHETAGTSPSGPMSLDEGHSTAYGLALAFAGALLILASVVALILLG